MIVQERKMKTMGVGVRPPEIAALLTDVYYAFSACVSLDDVGNVLALHLFDTAFAGDRPTPAPEASEVWLFTQHPWNGTALTQEDEANIARVRTRLCGAKLRVFVTGENIGCVEMEVE